MGLRHSSKCPVDLPHSPSSFRVHSTDFLSSILQTAYHCGTWYRYFAFFGNLCRTLPKLLKSLLRLALRFYGDFVPSFSSGLEI